LAAWAGLKGNLGKKPDPENGFIQATLEKSGYNCREVEL
jgi:hypothetical protein